MATETNKTSEISLHYKDFKIDVNVSAAEAEMLMNNPDYAAEYARKCVSDPGLQEPMLGPGIKNTHMWTHEHVLSLISSYTNKMDLFKCRSMKKKEVWDAIASVFNETSLVNVSGEACDKKWHNLMATYRGIVDNCKATGKSRRTWLYFDLIDGLVANNDVMASRSQKGSKRIASSPTSSSDTNSSSPLINKELIDEDTQQPPMSKRTKGSDTLLQELVALQKEQFQRDNEFREKALEEIRRKTEVAKELNETLKTFLDRFTNKRLS